ncbi:MAG TPA: TetR/AcrR family transcriptional regulator [Iamia sp.]|nr:TetR/AcrR family transcriptional regulator [Iamia sp.]
MPRQPQPAPDADRHESPLVQAAINRTLRDRYDAAAEEIARIVDAAYRVIERTGDVDPRMRDILSEAGLSTQAFYRHFPSKDDLLLVLLDDGRRRLAEYLEHRMEKTRTPPTAIRAWIEGVMAQAIDPGAAARTRPFLTNLGRLADQHPEAQQASIDAVVDLLEAAITEAVEDALAESPDPRADALAIYHLTTSAMQTHVLARTTPTPAEVKALVRFVDRALDLA